MATAAFPLSRPSTPRRLAWWVLALLGGPAALLLLHAAWLAIGGSTVASRLPTLPRTVVASEDFPGAAVQGSIAPWAAPALAAIAAPAAGTTGTTILPALPIPQAQADEVAAGESGVVPARPFALGRASPVDRGRALECLTAAIYYEAASEPDNGQRAVAQVILNRVRHPAFPATVCGVVYQGSERVGCQFSFACDGSMARVPMRSAWTRAGRVAAAALAGYVYAPVGLATHYHTYAVTPAWNRSLVMTAVVGAHFFHRWKGWWGTAAAFRQLYAGGEPLPGPHRALPSLAPAAPPALAVGAPVPITPPAAIQPAWRDASTPIASPSTPAARDDGGLPPAPQVLDRWKDSGQPLR